MSDIVIPFPLRPLLSCSSIMFMFSLTTMPPELDSGMRNIVRLGVLQRMDSSNECNDHITSIICHMSQENCLVYACPFASEAAFTSAWDCFEPFHSWPENPQSHCLSNCSHCRRSSQLLGSASVLPDHRVSHPLGLQDPERIRASIRREALGNKSLMYDRRSQTASNGIILNISELSHSIEHVTDVLDAKDATSDVWNQDLADGT